MYYNNHVLQWRSVLGYPKTQRVYCLDEEGTKRADAVESDYETLHVFCAVLRPLCMLV
jgi:hypothetical protein